MMRIGPDAARKNGQALRVLVLTNHFSNSQASEIVALQTAQWFARRGDLVTLGANSMGAPIKRLAADFQLTTQVNDIDLSAFDLIWCQHDLLSHLPLAAFERASRHPLPHVVLVSLSPYEPYEHVDGTMARALSAEIYTNSPETARRGRETRRGSDHARDGSRISQCGAVRVLGPCAKPCAVRGAESADADLKSSAGRGGFVPTSA